MLISRAIIAVSICVGAAGAGLAQGPTPPPLYRVFLSDGSALSSFGEWARVGDRVVFSMPLAPAAGAADLHLVSLPVQRIDLDRTERYAEAVRASHYASSRGEADFAQLSVGVAQTLNRVAAISDPKQRLATAEQARRTLAGWPGAHFGYRATEVRDILGVLDEVIATLRVQAGQRGFDIALSANTVAPASEPLLPAPDHAEVVHGLMTASRFVDSPVERISLLQSVVAFIDRAIDYLPASIAASLRSTALNDIAEERRVDSLYETLRTVTLADASRFAERADVRSLELLRERVRAHDLKLGNRRPDDVAGLFATLEVHLDTAHRLRLAWDQWLLSESRLLDYRRAISPYVQALLDKRAAFDDIKLLAGPAPHRLLPLARELNRHARFMALIQPPAQAAAVHAALRTAFSLAENAVQLRRDAVEATDVELAKRASSAAAGAVLLLERARSDLKAVLEPPVKISGRP